MDIRQVGTKDAEMVAGHVAALVAELSPGYRPDPDAMTATAAELLASGAVTGFAAEDGGAILGLVMLNECAAVYAGGRFGEITELYVAPPFRSQGVAGRLVARAVAFGHARGWQRLEVGAPDQPAWARTLAFYEREGFAEVGPRLRMVLQGALPLAAGAAHPGVFCQGERAEEP